MGRPPTRQWASWPGSCQKKKDDLLGRKDDLLAKARETSPESLVSAVQHAGHKARENPIELAAISAFALGFVVAATPTRRTR